MEEGRRALGEGGCAATFDPPLDPRALRPNPSEDAPPVAGDHFAGRRGPETRPARATCTALRLTHRSGSRAAPQRSALALRASRVAPPASMAVLGVGETEKDRGRRGERGGGAVLGVGGDREIEGAAALGCCEGVG